ncbi:MAG: bacillithiol system redox-active protein YtxJ [Bacteroidota bacterium]
MNWFKLESIDQLRMIREKSKESPVIIFKHSTTCSISRTALDRLERNWKDEEMSDVKPFYLDLLKHRDISREVATEFSVEHQSPQVLVIENGQAVYDRSHFDINYPDLLGATKKKVATKN